MKVFYFSLFLFISSNSVAGSSIFDNLTCDEIGNEAGKAMADLHTSRHIDELIATAKNRVEKSTTKEEKNLARFYWMYLLNFNKLRSIYNEHNQVLVVEKAKSIAIKNCIEEKK